MKKKHKSHEIEFGDLQEQLSHCEVDLCKIDQDGQLVYYTNVYKWKDGTYHKEPEHTGTEHE